MKIRLCVIALFSLITASHAQRMQLSANIGASMNTVPQVNSNPIAGQPNGAINPVGVVSALVNVGKWQIGAAVSGQRANYKTKSGYNMIFADPLLTADAILNRNIIGGFGTLYAGIAAGYSTGITGTNANNSPVTQAEGNKIKLPGSNGFNAGLQIGYHKAITKKFGLKAEVAGRYHSLSGSFKYTFVTVPVTVGATLSL